MVPKAATFLYGSLSRALWKIVSWVKTGAIRVRTESVLRFLYLQCTLKVRETFLPRGKHSYVSEILMPVPWHCQNVPGIADRGQ